jgi:hypothetical protein
MAYAPNRNQHSSLVWKYLTGRIQRILKPITEIGYDEKIHHWNALFIFIYLFFIHSTAPCRTESQLDIKHVKKTHIHQQCTTKSRYM